VSRIRSPLPARCSPDAGGKLIYANPAYLELAATLGRPGSEAQPPELMDAAEVTRQREALAVGGKPRLSAVTLGGAGVFDLNEFPVAGGSAGYLYPRSDSAAAQKRDAGLTHLSGIIDALATPIVIFNERRELVQANRAYMTLWNLDPKWLKLGMDERAILDKLRTDGSLPNEPDYHAWRAKHLSSYQLQKPKELEPWHLPDGRTIQVIAAPAGPQGGVIYVFEDITAQLKLQSQHRSLLLQPALQRALESADEPARHQPAYRPGRRRGGRGAARGWRLDLARPETQHHRSQPDAHRQAGAAHPSRRQADRLRGHPPARRADHDDLPRCVRERQVPAGAEGAQRCTRNRRPAERRLRPERQL
jgi:PAS domain-containing protein